MTIFPDEGLARSQQMFVDLNQHGVKPSRSLRLFYDARDDAGRVTRAVVEAVPIFRDLTDLSRTNLTAGSRKLFAFSNLHTSTSVLIEEAGIKVTQDRPDQAVDGWPAVVDGMPKWRLAGRGELAAAELRRDRVYAHGVALEAIAIAGARVMNERPDGWREALGRLGAIDRDRSNAAQWEAARCSAAGSIGRAPACS